jgi:Family of unknown function (DUF6261)
MKELQTVNLTRLSVLGFGQHIKSVLANVDELGKDFITDAPLRKYLQDLNVQMGPYDKAVLQITKSDETKKIVAADKLRDNVLTSLFRQLSVYELSEAANELEAYDSLHTVFNTYKGIQRWDFEQETNGIDNLLVDLADAKYKPHVELLLMQPWVDKLRERNAAFKALFVGRTQEVSSKESYDVVAMRKALKKLYTDTAEYVLSQAKALDNEQFNKCLDVINAVRKYYHDLLAKRTGGTDNPDTPIPLMA